MEIKKPKQIIGKEADKWMESLWEELLNKITISDSKDEIRKILESLLSEDERKMILRRLGVITFAKMGKSYKEISEALWLSPNTISTIRKNLLGNKSSYSSYRKFYKGPKIYTKVPDSFWKNKFDGLDIWEILTNPPRPVGMGLIDRSYSGRRRNKK